MWSFVELHQVAGKMELVTWKYRSEDTFIEVIVDPDFGGDIAALASVRPVWIVDSPRNRPRIDAAWGGAPQRVLFEVSRCHYEEADQRVGNLLDIVGCLDDHHPHHNIVVHGLDAADVRAQMEAEGFQISEVTPDGFVAMQDASIRDRLIGRA
jgi:hypothetical protein